MMSDPAAPAESFVAQVKDALEHIYDLGYLQQMPLAEAFRRGGPTPEIAGQHLRREVFSALEALNPGEGTPFYSRQARLYNLLDLRYVQMLTLRETSQETGLSLRQVQRELKRAEESLASVLQARRGSTEAEYPKALSISSLEAEIERLGSIPQPVDVGLLIKSAQEAVLPQASQRGVRVHVRGPDNPLVVSTDRVLAEQILINLLSRAVEQAQPGSIRVRLAVALRTAAITVEYLGDCPAALPGASAGTIVDQLCERLGWRAEVRDRADGIRVATLHIVTCRAAVLVIDDNRELIELLRRFLTHHACRVISAVDALEGLRLARETPPDAIILDVMVPEMHGWEILQRLRIDPRTREIPVIVCSVITNPELALALGATLFLPKPVTQPDVLGALRQIGVL